VCDVNQEWQVEARVQALLETMDSNLPHDIQKLINFLKLTKACGINGIPDKCLRHIPRAFAG
jgi:hypothetical protein